MKFLVSHQGQQSGPFTLAEIVDQVRAKKLDLFDYIYDEGKSDWVLLMEHTELAAQIKQNKPAGRPKLDAPSASATATAPVVTTPSASAHAITEWFVLKGDNRFGPFTFTDVVSMLQQKTVYPFDFVWHSGMPEWKRVAEVADFTPESIRKFFQEGGTMEGGKTPFIQRRFQRHKYSARVFVHDNRTLWKGEAFEISKGGVGLTMPNSLVVPGQEVTVHLHAHDGWPALNALCEVVSKKFVNDDSPVEYGLRFLSLSQDAQDAFYKRVA